MQDMEEDPGSYLGAAGLTVRYREHYGDLVVCTLAMSRAFLAYTAEAIQH
jgi:hypothetical protein